MKLLFLAVILNFIKFTYTGSNNFQNGIINPVKVSIYYETLCSDSANFITKQLYPAYKILKRSLVIEFIPYGKADQKKIRDMWIFNCQHGPKECWGNTVQACALAQRRGQDAEVEFINCFMNRASSKHAVFVCSELARMSYTNLMKCVNGHAGDELLAKYGDKTKRDLPGIKFVPTIIFNNEYNELIDEEARKNFLATTLQISNGSVKKNLKYRQPVGRRRVINAFNGLTYNNIYNSMRRAVYGPRVFPRSEFSHFFKR